MSQRDLGWQTAQILRLTSWNRKTERSWKKIRQKYYWLIKNKGKERGKRIPTVTHLLTRVSTGCPWERYSTIMVQKNSRSQWSGNFSQPPSAIGNEDLNTQNLIGE